MDGSLEIATVAAWRLRRGSGIEGLAPVRLPRHGTLQRDEVRVRIRAVALNYRDLVVARGNGQAAGEPITVASDAAGEVIEVGPEVTRWQVGDRVIASFFPDWTDGGPKPALVERALGGSLDGVLAEERVLPEDAWVRAPAHLDFVEAATLPCAGLVAWNALFETPPARAGDSVLLLGTGGVSVWALQLAKAAGLRVIITSSDEAKLTQARALGADATINYREHTEWQDRVMDLTAGAGVDRVLEVGGVDTLSRSLSAVRMGGSLAIIGRLSGNELPTLDPAAVYGGFKQLVGVLVGSARMLDSLARFTELHGLRPVVDRVFGFQDTPAAYRHLESGRAFGKIVVRLGD
jgi:NADPH:quinone reductase-like Zn-dependent oxidoreductase